GIGSTSAGESRQSVLVVDALTDGDLDLVVGSAPHDDIVWAGSAGLYAALARQARRRKRVLVVCGSASPMAARQVSEVRASGAETFVIDHDLDARELGHVEEALGRGGVVVLAAPEREAHSVLEGSHAGRLAETAAGIVGVDGYVFVGGHTAERCFAALGVGFAEIAGVADPGTALGRFSDPDGRPFVSKAGSFGDEASLVRAIRAVRSLMTRGPE
ncbi:MAG: nucleotide-binding domain containing protein, partial [Humibacter sp.]